jgi:hypothetical protein
MEALFLLTIQMVFCIAILNAVVAKKVYEYEGIFELDLCQFFTALILHFGSIQNVRNGI